MLELINESNSHIFDELAQTYEDEFSATSGKTKNQDGKYSIDVDWRTPNVGYYWKESSQIVGFSILDAAPPAPRRGVGALRAGVHFPLQRDFNHERFRLGLEIQAPREQKQCRSIALYGGFPGKRYLRKRPIKQMPTRKKWDRP